MRDTFDTTSCRRPAPRDNTSFICAQLCSSTKMWRQMRRIDTAHDVGGFIIVAVHPDI